MSYMFAKILLKRTMYVNIILTCKDVNANKIITIIIYVIKQEQCWCRWKVIKSM